MCIRDSVLPLMKAISFIYPSLTQYFPLKEGNVNRPLLNTLEKLDNEHSVKKVGKEPRTIKLWLITISFFGTLLSLFTSLFLLFHDYISVCYARMDCTTILKCSGLINCCLL